MKDACDNFPMYLANTGSKQDPRMVEDCQELLPRFRYPRSRSKTLPNTTEGMLNVYVLVM